MALGTGKGLGQRNVTNIKLPEPVPVSAERLLALAGALLG